jgi:hypothetical protein
MIKTAFGPIGKASGERVKREQWGTKLTDLATFWDDLGLSILVLLVLGTVVLNGELFSDG